MVIIENPKIIFINLYITKAQSYMKNILLLSCFLFTSYFLSSQPIDFLHKDVGPVTHPGYFKFDAEDHVYYLAGAGHNIWGNTDGFSFAYLQMTGNFILTTSLKILGEGGDPHRKAGLMVREGLQPNAAYADAVVHGDGLTSLQYRLQKGRETAEITNSKVHNAYTLRIEKIDSTIIMYAAQAGKPMQKIGNVAINFSEEFYIGLIISAHQQEGFEQAKFFNTRLTVPVEAAKNKQKITSRLETINIHTGVRKIIFDNQQHFEAPNWSPDGSFIFNSNGLLYRLHPEKDGPQEINTGFANRCNNDHGISLDGKTLAISHRSDETNNSIIYTLPITGGVPDQVTEKGPSYWHGWSPDGSKVTYCAERNGEYDVYTSPVTGGREKRLTTSKGLDDGPEYTADGQYIYFNSVRTGKMQIWRMKPDGSDQEQMTFDIYNDWFPHPSPDGKWVAFISYEDEVEPGNHPGNKKVMLRIMPLEGGEPKILAYIYGGQGTINVPSWSPESNDIAFVSYTYRTKKNE